LSRISAACLANAGLFHQLVELFLFDSFIFFNSWSSSMLGATA